MKMFLENSFVLDEKALDYKDHMFNELEKYKLVARSEEYAVSATGNELKYRTLLTEAIID